MDFEYILELIKYYLRKFFKRCKKLFKKSKKLFRKYIRMLVRHTKAKDYSILIYTILAFVSLILIIVLLFTVVRGVTKTIVNVVTPTTTEAPTTTELTLSPEEQAHIQLVEDAKLVYSQNSSCAILINVDNELPETYSFEHYTLKNGKEIDTRILPDFQTMLTDCNDAGFEYNIVSAYRDRAYQQNLVDAEKNKFMSEEGLSEEEAYAKALTTTQKPGCSEHEAGLAMDIRSAGSDELTTDLEADPTNAWLIENSYKYGFILRYPKTKIAITGIDYEPWHFRYVGIPIATFMHNNDLCLEEFYALVNEGGAPSPLPISTESNLDTTEAGDTNSDTVSTDNGEATTEELPSVIE